MQHLYHHSKPLKLIRFAFTKKNYKNCFLPLDLQCVLEEGAIPRKPAEVRLEGQYHLDQRGVRDQEHRSEKFQLTNLSAAA